MAEITTTKTLALKITYPAFLGTALFLAPGFYALAGEVHLTPDQNIVAIVHQEPPGTTFIFSPGVYRSSTITPKDHDVFTGEGQAILNGSQVLAMLPDHGRWSAVVTRAPSGPGHCLTDHPRCWILNDLFVDDQLQTPADRLDQLMPGQWFYDDASGKAYMSTDPAGHQVEWGRWSAAFAGKSNGVTIRHLIVEKYASPPQIGAVGGHGTGTALDWTVDHCDVRWNHGTGIDLGSHAHVTHNHILHNGQKGLGAHGDDDLIDDNEIAFNGYGGYDPGWEAGATKFSATDRLVVRSNNVHDNFGGGLWNDIDNIHSLFEKNTLVNNANAIRIEISYDAIIRNNLLIGNQTGIDVVCSPHVEVYGNVIQVPTGRTNDGIELTGGERGSGRYGPHVAQYDHVHNNIISYSGPEGHSGLSGGLEHAENNIFDYNEYHLGGSGDLPTHWNFHGGKTLEDMRKAGFERHGTLSNEKATAPDPTAVPDGTYPASRDVHP